MTTPFNNGVIAVLDLGNNMTARQSFHVEIKTSPFEYVPSKKIPTLMGFRHPTAGSASYLLKVVIHFLQWAEAAQKAGRRLSSLSLAGAMAAFATNNLRWLLSRHLEAYRLNLEDWPLQWPGWPHGNDAEVV